MSEVLVSVHKGLVVVISNRKIGALVTLDLAITLNFTLHRKLTVNAGQVTSAHHPTLCLHLADVVSGKQSDHILFFD